MIKTIENKITRKQAIQFTGDNCFEVLRFMGRESDIWEAELQQSDCPTIHTLEGDMNTSPGDWIIKGLRGEFYPCKPDIFEKSYNIIE